jgi:adenylate cyclase
MHRAPEHCVRLLVTCGRRRAAARAGALMSHHRSAMKVRMSGQRRPFDPIPLHAWLIEAGLSGLPAPEVLDGFCRRLVAAGVPLSRGFLSLSTLHPQRRASSLTWEQGAVLATDFGYAYMQTASWQTSPFHHMLETGARRLHRRLAGDGAVLDFPVLSEFAGAGHTEWLALIYGFGADLEQEKGSQLGVVSSWATDHVGGWTAAELEIIEEVSGTLALAIQGSSALATTRDVLATYLGADAAARVVAGHVQRGSVGRFAAFILTADLRGFTDFAEVTAPEEVTRRLNGYFDCMGEAITTASGEILKFMGDGLLATFLPKGDADKPAVAAATLAAAHDILARVAALNAAEAAAGKPALAVDIALHQGDVTYGNVGTADRLDFTAIGPAINEAARLEGLCKELGRNLLISDSFVRAAPALRPQLQSLGRHRLRGVREPREVFTSGSPSS